jgi:seryl-tRNA synthetase
MVKLRANQCTEGRNRPKVLKRQRASETSAMRRQSPFVCLFCRRSPRKPVSLIPLSTYRRNYSRPSFAPKPILDIKHIIRNPGLYAQNCEDRNYKAAAQNAWKIHELAQQRAKIQNDAKDAREAYNKLKGEIERLQRSAQKNKKAKEDDDDVAVRGVFEAELSELLSHAKMFKEDMSKVTEKEKSIEDEIQDLALALPNLSSVNTPTGEEAEIVDVVKGPYFNRNKTGTSHVDIGAELDILDFSASATTSGWGFYFLRNEGALLEQALVQYTLDFLRRRGWTIVTPPSIVYSHIAAACGFQPRDANDEQQIYNLQQPTRGDDSKPGRPGLSLAATAEIPLAGMYAGKTFTEAKLPVKMVAASRCYRAEAGARGVDTKGLYRVHEFTKVEMFAWTLPDEHGHENFDTASDASSASPAYSHSASVFEEMVTIQRELLSSLSLSYRVLEMPTADLGGPATRKIDMEAFFPSRREIKDDGWGEVTSTSICTDYQSRRLGVRVKRGGEKAGSMEFPHTVNGTAMAVPRVLAALLESGWDEKSRTVEIPEVLGKWMGGIHRIEARK